jgi:hypothetical protein
MIYDASWDFITTCAYTNLTIPGAKHSGDFTEAPYPNGARESVDVNIEELLKSRSEKGKAAKYMVVICHVYSGQSLDELADASCFVADPSLPGTGPGGMHILSAARLSGAVGYM